MHRKVAAALIAALTLALASCGGGQKTETVSRAQVVSRLEAACLAGQREARKQAQRGSGREVFLHAIIANLRTIRDKVGNLETSGSGKAAFDSYKETVRARLDAFERIAAAGRADQPRVIRAERSVIGAGGQRAHAAIVRLGAEHVCI
jgi:acyl-CoA reductase-like NAD-dependent aldehyde dehydrogenase